MGKAHWPIGTILLICAGCWHGPRTVADPDPADKIPAIRVAVAAGDKRVIPQLVHDLDSDDSAIRFYSIEALKKMTGQTLGYRYYEEAEQRKPAVQAWKRWLTARTPA